MKTIKSYPMSQLNHQFLKPKNIAPERLYLLIAKLYEAGFIELYHCNEIADGERYSETEKMTNRNNRDELFKIVGGL